MRPLVPLLLLVGCSEYGLNNKDDNPPAGEPVIDATPSAWDLVLCAPDVVRVTVSNEGTAALAVEPPTLSGEGWTLLSQEAFTLQPNEQTDLELEPGVGEATLTLTSDDPANPQLTIPLRAVADQPPTVSILSPSPGEIIDIGAEERVIGEVTDDVDVPSALAVSWTSDVDGELSVEPADGAGQVELSWRAGERSAGEHQLVLTATDSCGQIAFDTIPLCQQAGYAADELDIGTWHFEGDASWDAANGWVQLTSLSEFVVGTAFQTAQTAPGDALEIRFSFYIGDGTGADGLSLTALDTTRMTGFLGGSGCGMGYGGDASCTDGPALPGWSIEVDTFYNEGQDPTAADHLMFTFDGDVDDPAFWTELPPMESNGWHTMEVVVNAPRVTVTVDAAVVMDQELSGHFQFPAYIGFTAGTGSLTNRHLIQALEVIEFACE
ncbi:MAG: hypothetical protein H6739_12020 [Alphaproteobacteria bacterium]|nr:hypothetical protein [Alphaproteobacteria bacterium]